MASPFHGGGSAGGYDFLHPLGVSDGIVGGQHPGHRGELADGIRQASVRGFEEKLIGDPVSVGYQGFLQAIFVNNWHFAYVTGFPDDPSAIAPDRRGACWNGTLFPQANGQLADEHNVYFCVSIFALLNGWAVRRKAQFLGLYVVVADDVGTKVPEAQARLLPKPSYILETSPGNYQWGWILREPETNRVRAEALIDGLVKLGLSPDGTDPGMKGVTRLVRLPGGVNNKQKYVDELGEPWKVRLVYWNPAQRVTIEELAGPFGIDLGAAVQAAEAEVSGAVWPDDAPLMRWLAESGSLIEQKNESEYLIRCPWVDEHSDGDDSGTWLRTLENGSGEFKCHHGHCQDRKFHHFLDAAGIKAEHDAWRAFRGVEVPPAPVPAPGDAGAGAQGAVQQAAAPADGAAGADPFTTIRDYIHATPPRDPAATNDVLQRIAMVGLDAVTLDRVMQELSDHSGVRISTLRTQLRALSAQARAEDNQGRVERIAEGAAGVLEGHAFVAGSSVYVRLRDMLVMKRDAFNSSYGHLEFVDPRNPFNELGLPNHVKPSDAFDFNPNKLVVAHFGWTPTQEVVFHLEGQELLNTHRPPRIEPVKGDVSRFLELVYRLVRDPVLAWLWIQHMAYTLRHPEKKIRWGILCVGMARIGKSTIVYALKEILGKHASVIEEENLGAGWGDYFAGAKVVIFEEVHKPGDYNFWNSIKAKVGNADIVSLNMKGGSIIRQRNLASVYLYSNHDDALAFKTDDNKLLVIKIDRPMDGLEDLKDTARYCAEYCNWVDNVGLPAIYHYLLHEVNLENFTPGSLPLQTDAYHAMARNSQYDYELHLDECVEDDTGPFAKPAVTTQEVKDYLSDRNYRVSNRGLGNYLRKRGFESHRGQQKNAGSVRFWTRENIGGQSLSELYDWYIEVGCKPNIAGFLPGPNAGG